MSSSSHHHAKGITMPNFTDMERQFRSLQEEVVNAYEEKIKRSREQDQYLAGTRQQHQEQVRDIMRAAQVDISRLERLGQQKEAALLDFLRVIRPPFIE